MTTTPAFIKARVLSGYRRLFRARRVLFHGDNQAMAHSRFAIRSEFDKNRYITPITPTTLEPYFIMIDEAEDMLLNGFARGELNRSSGNYEIKLKAEHAGNDHIVRDILEPVTKETGANIGKIIVHNSQSRNPP